MDLLRSFLSMVVWNNSFEDSPSGGDDPSYGDDEITLLKEAIRERLAKEHKMDLSVGTASSDGWHKSGTALVYFQAAEPTLRPDGATALNANDNGRLWIRSTDYRTHVYMHSEGWIVLTALVGTSNEYSGDSTFSGDCIFSGDNTFTGENEFTGDPTFNGTRFSDMLAEIGNMGLFVWRPISDISGNAIGAVEYNSGTYIANGADHIYRCVDGGVTWTEVRNHATPAGRGALSTAYGNGIWMVAVYNEGLYKSTDDGETWSSDISGAISSPGVVAYGNETWVVIDRSSGEIYYSTNDGDSWALVEGTTVYPASGIIYDGSRFIAQDGNKLYESSDGVTWTEAGTLPSVTLITGFAYASGNKSWLVSGRDESLNWCLLYAFADDLTSWSVKSVSGNVGSMESNGYAFLFEMDNKAYITFNGELLTEVINASIGPMCNVNGKMLCMEAGSSPDIYLSGLA